jgi:hypothetical protein
VRGAFEVLANKKIKIVIDCGKIIIIATSDFE